MDGSATSDPLRAEKHATKKNRLATTHAFRESVMPAETTLTNEVFQRMLLESLPLAQAVLLLCAYALDHLFLERLFSRYRGRCYTRKLTFTVMIQFIRDALSVRHGSGRAAFMQCSSPKPSATLRAVYRKLSRMPLGLSMALVRESVLPLIQVMPGPVRKRAASLKNFRCIVMDGKTIKHVTHRLKILRHWRGRVVSGKMLAALDLDHGLIMAFECTRDSAANDCSLVDGLLKQLGPAPEGEVRLFINDRQFSDLPRLRALGDGDHHFLIRHNRNLPFYADPNRQPRKGRDRRGLDYVEEWGWMGQPTRQDRYYVRRITLVRPTEEENVSVITDLLDEQRYPAQDLLDVYLERWEIERVFERVTEVFHLKTLIGGDPLATLFQTAFCCVLYNQIQVVRAHVAAGNQKPVEEISTHNLFTSCSDQLKAWAVAGEPKAAAKLFSEPLDAQHTRPWLQRLLGRTWHEAWRKAPKQPKHGKTLKTHYPTRGYSNVARLQDADEAKKRRARRKMASLTKTRRQATTGATNRTVRMAARTQ